MTMRSKDLGLYATRGLLLASGLLAAGIAATSFLFPNVFYEVYGIDVGSNVNLTNELRASAGALFVAGLLTLSGLFKAELVKPALGIATVVYLSYGLSRLASMAIDGSPDSALVGAAVVELFFGGSCLMRLVRLRTAVAG